MLKISTTPHIFSPVTTQKLMLDVIIALCPAILVALLMFGLGALKVLLTSIAACVLFEYLISRYCLHKENTIRDFSAIITGILLAFNLPSNFPTGMILIGAFVAIVITKMAFGGLGKNIFNPALAGRVFLFISFPVQMTSWPRPQFLKFIDIDAETAPTTLNILKHSDIPTEELFNHLPSYWQMFLGHTGGCIGEVSALALLLGFGYLLWKKVIHWHIPVYYIGTFLCLTTLTWLITDKAHFSPLINLLSGGLLLGAIFMATDYTTSPMTRKGQILFAIGCGVLTYVIRFYSAYPEGVSFAILIMNSFVPLIDMLPLQRVYGTRRK